jgi:hypothetical protein
MAYTMAEASKNTIGLMIISDHLGMMPPETRQI